MPFFSYQVKNSRGEGEKGVKEGKDEFQLARELKVQGLTVIKIEEVKKKEALSFNLPFFSRISISDKLMFTRNLQVMVGSGLALPRSLEILSLQTTNEKFKKVLGELREGIIKGETFSEMLKKYPNIFPELYQNMVKVGEESGTLEEVLGVLAKQIEKQYELQSRIRGALMYPLVIVTATIIVGVLMMILVLPKLAATFDDLGVELPFTTKMIMNMGIFMSHHWYLVILLFVFLALGVLFVLQNRTAKKKLDYLVLKMPIISPLVKKTNAAYFSRTLSSLIIAGVPLVRSLEIVATVLSNFYFKKGVLEAIEKIRKGERLGESLEIYKNTFPVLVVQMIKVGEETGETSKILSKLADFFEEEVSNITKNMSSIIEPILMIFIGIAVGFFAVSMMQPMYSMMGSIQ